MTHLQLKTTLWYIHTIDWYITRATGFREDATEYGVWWKPKIKKHWLFLLKMAQFYTNTAKDPVKK